MAGRRHLDTYVARSHLPRIRAAEIRDQSTRAGSQRAPHTTRLVEARWPGHGARSDEVEHLTDRYSERPNHDPGENRLTAALTGVLQVHPSLARALMKHIVPHLVLEEDPAVKTQTTIRLTDGRHAFLDMEITASTPEPTNVWKEVKRTSGESGSDQFEKYQQTLAEKKGQRVMLILAPSHMRTHLGQLPPAHEWRPDADVCPHWISWEDVYEALAALPTSTQPILGRRGRSEIF